MMRFHRWLSSMAVALALAGASLGAWAQDKVVYHIDAADQQATKGLRNIRNHLDVEPKAQIVAVAHAEGVDFLMEGAKTTNNQEFAALVADLSGRGVKFEICEITLKNRNLKKDQFILGPSFTPSGVVRSTLTSLSAKPDTLMFTALSAAVQPCLDASASEPKLTPDTRTSCA